MKDIIITAEQVEKMLKKREKAEERWERACERDSDFATKYAAELIAMESLLDIIGIEY